MKKMIFLKPGNIFEFLFQSLINTIFRLRQSVKKRFIQKVEKTYTTSNISQDLWSFLYTSYKTDLSNSGLTANDS